MPSQFSWWWRTNGTTGYGKSIAERISAPIGACSFIFSNSAGVSLPGLLRMCSGTAILPVSCSSAAASIAFSSHRFLHASHVRAPRLALHATNVPVRDVVLGVDRGRQGLDRREVQAVELPMCCSASSSRPNVDRSIKYDNRRGGNQCQRGDFQLA